MKTMTTNDTTITVDDDGCVVITPKGTSKTAKGVTIEKDGTIKGDVEGNVIVKGDNVTLVIEGDVEGNIVGGNEIIVKGDIEGNVIGNVVKG